MQNQTGNYIILNNTQANVAQNSIHLASTASMSPSVSDTSDMLTNDINALENSLLSLIDQSSTTASEAATAAGNLYASQQQAINGYSTINSILNGSLSQTQYKTIIQQPQSPVSSKKLINQITTTPTNKKTIIQQQQHQQSPYLNLNLLQSSATSNTGQNPIKLINTSPNVLQPQQQQQQQQRLQIIQTTPQVSQQQAILYTSSSTTTSQSPQQIQIINTTNQQAQQQQQQAAPTIAFLNINNRMVPLQTVNIQQKQQQSTTQSPQALKFVIPSGDQQQQQFVVGNDASRIIMSTGQQQAQQKPQQSAYYVVQSSQIQQHLNSSQTQQLQLQPQKINVVQLSGNTVNNNNNNNNIDNTDSSQQANANLVSQIPEKMKTLEQIQLQLRAYQMKIQNALNSLKRDVSNLTQQQQIQLVLSQSEQITLQKLMQRRKDVQNEIQQLQQKLLAPSANNDQQANSTTNVMIASNSNKQDVYNGIINSINTMKAKNDLTLEELDKLKKLIEYKLTFETKFNLQPAVLNGSVQNENKTTSLNRNTDDDLFSTSTVQQQQQHQQATNNLPIINIKIQSPNVLQNATSTTLNQSQKVITIAGSPSTVTSAIAPNAKNRNILMAQQSPNQQQQQHNKPISGSIKIRNVPICTVGSFGSTPTVLPQNITPVTSTALKTKPIRTIIGNTSYAQNGNATVTTTANNNVFKLLNYDVLAQSGVINKKAPNDLIIKLIKQLDDKIVTLNNAEKQQALLKNQVQIVKKYLEQFHPTKIATIKNNKIYEQLLNDQQCAVNPDCSAPFRDRLDAFKRLSAYHVFQHTEYEPTDAECEKFDECFEKVSQRYLKAADAMINRFHVLQLRTMQRTVPITEESLILKLYMDDAKLDFEDEKKHKNDVNLDDIDTIKRKIKKIERCLSYDENADQDTSGLTDTNTSAVSSTATPSPPSTTAKNARPRHSNLIKRFKYEIEHQDTDNVKIEDDADISATSTPTKTQHDNNSRISTEYDETKQHIKLKIKLVKNETIDDFINVNTNNTYQTVADNSSSVAPAVTVPRGELSNRSTEKTTVDNEHNCFAKALKDELFDTSDCQYNDENGDDSTSQLDTSATNYSASEHANTQPEQPPSNTTYEHNYENCNTNNSNYAIDDSALNNLSCLDDFIMDEDELAVQSILDNYN